MAAETTHATDLVTVDAAKKRVYLHFRGFMTKEQADALKESYRQAIAQVGPGYTAVSIFEEFMPRRSVIRRRSIEDRIGHGVHAGPRQRDVSHRKQPDAMRCWK